MDGTLSRKTNEQRLCHVIGYQVGNDVGILTNRDRGYSIEKSGNGAWMMTKVKTKNEHDPRVTQQYIFERGDKGAEIVEIQT